MTNIKLPSSSEKLTQIAVGALEDLKAVNITVLNVTGISSVADAMIVASGTSSRHVKSLSENVKEVVRENGIQPLGIEGAETAEWILVDLGDVIVHIMQPSTREFYDLERLWTARPDDQEESQI
ncbi:MAG: ribosome silencing factor [Pseudomonadales bacterium]|nr:ribosome silencing factor [Pseudomonadales bacterium]